MALRRLPHAKCEWCGVKFRIIRSSNANRFCSVTCSNRGKMRGVRTHRFTAQEQKAVRKLIRDGADDAYIAALYGLSRAMIYRIATGERWT